MKIDKILKISLLILVIILVSIISFTGIFVQEKNYMKDILKEYKLGADLEGSRVVSISAKSDNKEDVLNEENYKKTKEIIQKRLDFIKSAEYKIRQNEKNGDIRVELTEDENTELAIQFLYTVGELTIEDEEGNVLLNNSNLEEVKAGYGSNPNGSVSVYLNMKFNEESKEKLKEISKTYKTVEETTTENEQTNTVDEEQTNTTDDNKSKDEENKEEEQKTVNLKLDGNTLLNTSFSEEITDGTLSLSLGTVTNTNDLNTYLKEASNIAVLLNNEKLPISYEVGQNRFVKSDIQESDLYIVGAVIAVIILVVLVLLLIKYKSNGILASISTIGFIAVLLLVLRYANVVITIPGLIGILISVVFNIIFNIYVLKNVKKAGNDYIEIKKVYGKSIISAILIIIPTLIVGITLTFSTWLPMYSFGSILFWGTLLMLIYNLAITRTLILCNRKK